MEEKTNGNKIPLRSTASDTDSGASTSTPTSGEFDLSKLDPNIAAVFAYLIPLIGGIAFFLYEKKNKFVRFHAFQAILFWAAVIAVNFVVNTFFGLFMGFGVLFVLGIASLVHGLIALAVFGAWLFLVWKAYNKEEYEIPYLGKIARDQANKD